MTNKFLILISISVILLGCFDNNKTYKVLEKVSFTYDKEGELVVSEEDTVATQNAPDELYTTIKRDTVYSNIAKALSDVIKKCYQESSEIRNEIEVRREKTLTIRASEKYTINQEAIIDKEGKIHFPPYSTYPDSSIGDEIQVETVKVLTNEGKRKVNGIRDEIEKLRIKLGKITRGCRDQREKLKNQRDKYIDERLKLLNEEIDSFNEKDSLKIIGDKLTNEYSSRNVRNISEIKRTLGKVGYYLPDTMIVNKPTIVELVISPYTLSDSTLRSEHSSSRKWNKIVIDKLMIANLIDPSLNNENFHIESYATEQEITQNEFTKWIWDITPKKRGQFPLRLAIQIIEIDSLKKRARLIDVFKEEITIITKDNFISIIQVVSLIGAGLLAIVSFILVRRRHKMKGSIVLFNEYNESILKLVKEDKIEQALEKLLALTKELKNKRKMFLNFNAQLKRNNQETNLGIISNEESRRVRNKITHGILKEIEN